MQTNVRKTLDRDLSLEKNETKNYESILSHTLVLLIRLAAEQAKGLGWSVVHAPTALHDSA